MCYNVVLRCESMFFPKLINKKSKDEIIRYEIIKTKKRLTFDIRYQNKEITYQGLDDGDYFVFNSSNGYQIISRSRMDIQTERLWLLGASNDERSGSMVFSSDEKRDLAYNHFELAILEWINYLNN